MTLKYIFGRLICIIYMSHVQRIWKIKNNNRDKKALPCISGWDTNFFTNQADHHPHCGCEFLDFYLCKRCGKDITEWTKHYKPNPEYEYLNLALKEGEGN